MTMVIMAPPYCGLYVLMVVRCCSHKPSLATQKTREKLMSRFTDEELTYLDISWLLVDVNDEIAILTTGGTGYIPRTSFVDKEEFDILYTYVDDLPIMTGAASGIDVEILLANHRYTAHEEDLILAEKGLYVFDAMTHLTYNPKQYALVAYPCEPLKLGDVDARIAPLLKAMRHTGVKLSRSSRIDLSEL
ncbi:hypothetical protein [Deinococcus phoenicis]|uniref:hypothetical protein n=1 Tax=Deinococcus phoenicis TaxID=1476583 RepID=UPI001267B561|nr:hypothetical protein [Deinococcus phoenicis]